MNFRFLNQVEPSTYATNLANGMHTYSIPHTVCGSHLQFQCDLAEIAEFLTHFRPDNSIITVSHRGFSGKTTLKEKYYGTEHNKLDFTPAQVALWAESLQSGGEWVDALSLPLPNPFIPTDFALKTVEADAAAGSVAVPVIIERQSTTEVKHELLEEVERPPEPAVPVATEGGPPVPPTAEQESAAEGQEADPKEQAEEAGADHEDEEDEEEGDEEEEGAGNSGAELPVLAGDKLLTWHLQDATWAVPKVNVKVSLESLFSSATAHSVVLTELFAMCLKENLNEYSYYADCAGKGDFRSSSLFY